MLCPRIPVIMLALVLGPLPLFADMSWQGSTAVVWHGNVTNSDRSSDRLSALQWQSELAGTARRQMSGRNVVSASLRLGLELWPQYEGLDAVRLGPGFGLTHKFGFGPQAWVLHAEVTGDLVLGRESPRSGLAGQLRLEASKRWGDSWQFFLGTERARLDARGRAFSHSGRENYLRTEYQINDRWRLAAELRQRAGVVVSYTTPPRPDLVQAGKVLTLVDTFQRDVPLLAYYFPADTTSGSLEITRQLRTNTAVFARFEYRKTTHFDLRYLNQRSSIGVIHRF